MPPSTPINQREIKKAMTRFWGLYGALGFGLLCILAGGLLSTAFSLSEQKEARLDEFEKAREESQVLAFGVDSLASLATILYKKQHDLHRRLQPTEGTDITMHEYRAGLNGVASEAKELYGNLQRYYNNVETAQWSSALEKSSLRFVQDLIAAMDTAHQQLYGVAKTTMKIIPGDKAVGIRSIHEGIAEGEVAPPADPALVERDTIIAQLQRQIAALLNKDQNAAQAALNNELQKSQNETKAQKSLVQVYQHLSYAKGMLEVAEQFVKTLIDNKAKNKVKESSQAIVENYKKIVNTELEAATAQLTDIAPAIKVALTNEIGGLKTRCNQLSLP